jgi:hypothetical protein
MRLLLQQIGFAIIALLVALLVIVPSFVVVDVLIREGYLVALIGITGLSAILILLFSRRFKGGTVPPASGLREERPELQVRDTVHRSP